MVLETTVPFLQSVGPNLFGLFYTGPTICALIIGGLLWQLTTFAVFMLVNGNETIKVSDGSQRAVASLLMFK